MDSLVHRPETRKRTLGRELRPAASDGIAADTHTHMHTHSREESGAKRIAAEERDRERDRESEREGNRVFFDLSLSLSIVRSFASLGRHTHTHTHTYTHTHIHTQMPSSFSAFSGHKYRRWLCFAHFPVSLSPSLSLSLSSPLYLSPWATSSAMDLPSRTTRASTSR